MRLLEVNVQTETLHVFKVLSNDMDGLLAEVATLANNSKNKFQYAPVILDIASTEFQANDLAVLVEILTQNNIVAVGIRSRKQELVDFAKFSGLAVFAKQAEPITSKPPENQAYQAPTVIDNRVYAFDQIVIKDTDLVLLGEVQSGAEVMVSGSISAYQETGGSLFAGVDGDETAHIFVRCFKAQLVSIAGIYKRFNGTSHALYKKSVKIDLLDGRLRFQTT